MNDLACQGTTPDLTILVDCDPLIGLSRARKRIEASQGPREERFELEAMAFHQRVRAGYLHLAAENPSRFVVINGDDSIEAIFATISQHVIQRLPEELRVIC